MGDTRKLRELSLIRAHKIAQLVVCTGPWELVGCWLVVVGSLGYTTIAIRSIRVIATRDSQCA